MGYLFIFLTVFFTVYGQLVFKWRMQLKGAIPNGNFLNKIYFILTAYLDLWIISGFAAAFLASMCWAATLTKFELSYAYPFTSLSFVLVFFAGVFLFNEEFNWYKVVGLLFIITGVIITAKF